MGSESAKVLQGSLAGLYTSKVKPHLLLFRLKKSHLMM